MDIHESVMEWVTLLPEVGDPILDDRAAIIALVREAAELEKQLSAKRAEAYGAAVALENRVRQQWTDAEIVIAKAKDADEVQR